MQTDDPSDQSADPGKYHGLGTTPVPGDSATGSRIVDWGALGREYFSKLSSPTGGAISWPAVAEAAFEMLGKTKDLRVALVATEALVRTEGLAGMADGFDLLACLGQAFGGDLFPKKESDRHAKVVQLEDFALEWVQGQRGSILPAAQLEVARVCAKVKAARGALAGPCADETVFARLERAMDSLHGELAPAGAAAPAPPATEATAAPTPAVPESVASPTTEPVASTPTAPVEQKVEKSFGAPGKYQALGSTPISQEQPAGDKITNWGQLATEYFQKLSSPMGGAINWNSVSSAALELLETGKDLRVALVATSALMKTGNFVGLADGLDLLGTLANTFGEDLHPRNPGDRHKKVVAFEGELLAWFGEKKGLLNPQGMEMLELALIKAEFARGALGEICGEEGVLARACRALKERKVELESEALAAVEAAKVKAAPVPAAGSASAGPSASRPATQVPDKIENKTELNRVLVQARKLMRLASKFFNENQAGEPITLRVERTAQWLCSVVAPPDDFLEQPDAEIKERLQGESSKGNASLDELRRLAGNYPFWLAGQRMLHAQLEADGRKEEAVVVRAESTAITSALVGLEKVKFKDGESVIDEATAAWLAQGQGSVGPALLGPDVSGVVDKKEEKLRKKVRREADKLALKERIPEAIAKYQLASQQCSTGRDRFLWKLELASFCFAHSPSIARSLLVDLEGEVAREGLGAWEPDLAIVVYTELLKLCPEDDVAKRDELFGKLVLIDPQRAARLQFPPANASIERTGPSKPPAGKKES